MSGKNSILGLSEHKQAVFLDIFILMHIQNFMFKKKSFITSGPGLILFAIPAVSFGRVTASFQI